MFLDYNINGNADEDVKIMLDTLGDRIAYPESKTVVDVLSEKFIVCIGSNTDIIPLEKDLERNHLQISKVYTSEELKCYKPCKKFYQSILDDLQIQPNEALFVGDSLTDDIAGPKSIGIKTCWINRKKGMSHTVVPDYEIKTLDELLEIVERKAADL